MSPGFRFHPTDEELITCYLMNKRNDATFTGRAIADVDLNKCEPWELPVLAISLLTVKRTPNETSPMLLDPEVQAVGECR
ncbi:unnamed protein product [Malus baccata var. baccata]